MIRLSMATLLILLSTLTGAFAHDPAARAAYLGNEGVMVTHGQTKILFDAFYANSYGQYALVPNEIAAAMMAGEAPYDGVDAIFVSHVHGDHFTAAPAIAYMRAQPNARLYGSSQVYDAIKAAGVADDDPLLTRIEGFDLSPEDKERSFEVDGLTVDVVAIPHAGNRPNIQNFAWRVTLDDETTVMHLGDAGPVRKDFERHKSYFDAKKTHAAFPPYWFFGHNEGEAILRDIIKADQATGVHVPARAAGNGDEWRANAGGDLFTDPGETREIGGR
jgi:L-ascorbate metabolism protein UlaG (beta-lactamase superfamily)